MRTLGRDLRCGAVRAKSVLIVVALGALAAGLYPIVQYARGEYRYRQALAAIDRKDFTQARKYLDACIEQWPTSAETRFLAARTARRAGDLEAAQQLLNEADRLGWVREAIELERALIMVQSGNRHRVTRYLLDAIQRHHPDSVLILEVLTPATLGSFEMDVADTCLNAWVELEPENAQVHVWRGEICERLMRNSEALNEYKKVLDIDPNNVEGRRKYAGLLLNQKLPQEALVQYEWLIQHQSDDLGIRRGYAYCLVNLGFDDKARPILEDLLKIRADEPLTMMILGQIELNAHQPQRAEEWFRKAYQRLPSEPSLLNAYAVCLQQNNKLDEADKIRKRQKQFEDDQDAARQLIKRIMQTPYDPEPRRLLAERLIRCGFEEEGRRWLQSGLAQDPNYGPIYESLAKYYDRFGDLKTAAHYRQRAEDLKKK